MNKKKQHWNEMKNIAKMGRKAVSNNGNSIQKRRNVIFVYTMFFFLSPHCSMMFLRKES